MKKIFYTLALILMAGSIYSQAPSCFKYQAVARDADGKIIADQEVGIQVMILKGGVDGISVYTETHDATTNNFGLMMVSIGEGTSDGDFSMIDWSDGPFSIKIGIDKTGGTDYSLSGVQQLCSVPYALYAENSGSSLPGPEGEKGDQGEQGMKGDKGEQGMKGDKGDQGEQGMKGDKGEQGMKGDKGDQGEQGMKGDKGDQGMKGDKGDQGEQGMKGDKGDQGEQGMKGDQGDQGEQGMKGETGDIGDIKGVQFNVLASGSPGSADTDSTGIWVAKTLVASTIIGLQGGNRQFSNRDPYLAVHFIIATQGTFPSRNGNDPFLAEIVMFGSNFAPRGWAFCDGQLISIASNSALFSLLGTFYGGDGRTTFALPDLRGRSAIHAGTGPGLTPIALGQKGGNENTTLNITNLPSHNHAAVTTITYN